MSTLSGLDGRVRLAVGSRHFLAPSWDLEENDLEDSSAALIGVREGRYASPRVNRIVAVVKDSTRMLTLL